MITVVHIVYNFDVGGLENVIVQLVNRLPRNQFRHVLVSLTSFGACAQRIERPDVKLIAMGKKPGHAIPLYPRLFRLLRHLRPDVLHTCNLAALETVPLGWAAGVPLRVHAEHGWDATDPRGENVRYRRLRRFYRPFVSHYVAVSSEIDEYLSTAIGVAPPKRSLIPNGVDVDVFSPSEVKEPMTLRGCGFSPGQHWLVGTVGRMQTVKNQPLLARAFVHFMNNVPDARDRARLVIVGEGPLRAEVEAILDAAGLRHCAWMPGTRSDIPDVMRAMDVFVLPSKTEGTSCTLQEAMATGLPSVCTAVGGTPDLLGNGRHGILVPSEDVNAMTNALQTYWSDPNLARQYGKSARQAVIDRFAVSVMLKKYEALFSSRRTNADTSYS